MTMIEFTAPGGESFGVYRAEPAGEYADAPRAALIVIHEIWGLAPHITQVADRLADQGYLVLAPDLLSQVGITPQVGAELLRLRQAPQAERDAQQPDLREKTKPLSDPAYGAWAVGALTAVVDALADDDRIGGRIAVLGFCFGGSYSFALAAADDRVAAAVPFYGAPPELDEVAKIHCPVHAFYGADDERLMEGLPAVTEAMDAAEVDFTSTVYPGAGHAFFNDTNPNTYVADAATDAWNTMMQFLTDHVDPPTATG